MSLLFGAPPALGQGLATPRKLTVDRADGGTVVTFLGGGIAVNKGSSLNRRWFVINDSTCPLYLPGIGIGATYKPDRYRGSYAFTVNAIARAVEEVRAFRLLFAQFNLWGEKMRNLAYTRVADSAKDANIDLQGEWYANENDVSEFFTSVAFVDQVMTANGQIWSADLKAIRAKLNEISLRVSESGLTPDPPKLPTQ